MLPRVNLLIADDVGLGKTVEGGLVMRELLMRRRIDFILVTAPPSMTLQTYLAGLRDLLGEFRSRALLILDEAHHAAPASGSCYAVDSQFTKAVRDVAQRFEHRLFLTATPHNGHSNS